MVSIVRERVSILCVDGSNGDAGRLLVSALLARSDGIKDEDYEVRSIPWISLPSEKLDEVDVLILANVPEITVEQVEDLSRFVRKGNGLVWFAGENVESTLWNERMTKGPNPLLPAMLGEPVEVGTALGSGRPLNPDIPLHGVCLPLRSLPEDLFSETLFLKRLEVEPLPSGSPVLNLAGSEAPILLEHSLGVGHVFLFATSAETSWNNMAQTPVFPMLMQQIVTYLTGREFEQSRVVGDSISLSYVEQPDAGDAVFETPSNQLITVPVGEYRDQFVARLENSRESGFYEARVSVQSPGTPIAVSVDPSESEVASLSAAELNANLNGTGVTIVNSGLELAAAIKSNRTERSFWRNFMIAGLVLLLAESLFADWLRKESNQAGPRKCHSKPSTKRRMPEVIPFIGPVEEVFWARPLSTGALLAILAGIILLSIYLYRRPWGMPLAVRVGLTISRVLVLALVVASLLEPTAVVKESLVQARSLPVLLDVSESMSIKDQRKRPEDIVSAAKALGMFSTEEKAEPDRLVMQLDTKQRQTSRLLRASIWGKPP